MTQLARRSAAFGAAVAVSVLCSPRAALAADPAPVAAAPGADASAAPAATPPGPSSGSGFRLAVQTEGAFGLTDPSFYNQLLGARVDYALPSGFALGGYLAYANLRGKNGRTSNVLPYAMLEYAPRWRKTSEVRLPFRFATGYLPKNGPVLRLSAGVSFPIGETTRLGFDVLAPTWWIIRNRTVVSLDFAAELTFAL